MAKVYRLGMSYFFLVPLLFALLMMDATVRSAQAASITVNESTCTLADAISTANDGTLHSGCVVGDTGADTITLAANVTLAAALPQITSLITIEGQGHFISGNNDENVGSVLHITDTGNLTLNETTVKEGKVSVYPSNGGGIDNIGGVVKLIDCTVSGNNTFADPSYPVSYGGGIYNSGGTVTLINSTVSGNTASSYGGGIFSTAAGTVTLTNSTVSGNSADDPNAGGGGGIANVSGSIVTLTNSTVSGNTASSYYGGGIYNAGGTATLTNSTISGNAAMPGGGGIYNNYSGTVTLTNSTISGNTASSTGGGIYNYSGTVTLHSSIISGNTAAVGNEVSNSKTINAASFNVFGLSGETSAQAFSSFTPSGTDVVATSDGGAPTALDAILNTTLADNGGPTKTHALVAGSPAIDLDATCSTGLTEDQRGEARPYGSGCDAGAFEGNISPVANGAFLPAIYFLLLLNP